MMHTPHTQQGFTLVETLVALTILSVVLAGAYSAVQTGFSGATFTRQDVTAYYLAEEGVEEIRNMRDENSLKQAGFLTGFAADPSDACYPGKTCDVDAVANSIIACSGGVCPQLTTDPATGLYGHSFSVNTPFTRSITLTPVNTFDYVVKVDVKWSKGAIQRDFSVEENLMDR